jgi:hypothetical protein
MSRFSRSTQHGQEETQSRRRQEVTAQGEVQSKSCGEAQDEYAATRTDGAAGIAAGRSEAASS